MLQYGSLSSALAGALDIASSLGWEVVPSIFARSVPGPLIADEVIKLFWSELSKTLNVELGRGLDGVFLVLHGAAVSESFDDVEGEILARIRSLPGASEVPVCGVIDLHANLTARMAEHADCLVAYRENPHTDAATASADAARVLDRLMTSGERPITLWRNPPIIWPPTGTSTASDPMSSLAALAREIERARPEILAVNVIPGFAYSDIPEAGLSFTAVTTGDPDLASAELDRLVELADRLKEEGGVQDLPIDELMRCLASHREGPIVIAESSDNIGAGAPGDGTGLLRALIAHRIENAVVVIDDPQAVEAVASLGPGLSTVLSIGGKGSPLDNGPVELDVELISTSDGHFRLEDPRSPLASMMGEEIDMGPCAVVRHRGITILLTSRPTPPFDLGQLRSQGIEPESCFVIGVKAAAAHKQAYDPIAKAHYSVDTPGPCSSDLARFPYTKLRRPIYPLDRP